MISAVVSAAVALLLAVVNPFTQRLLERAKTGFQRELEIHRNTLVGELEHKKAALQGELAKESASFQGKITQEVQLQLGERAAQRQYEYEARRRLYSAIGPLRFQLLLACRECAGRIVRMGLSEQYALSIDGYYGRNTLYRLLRPLAILELIERQVAYSDFAISQGALDCLRLKNSMGRIWSGDEVVLDHPDVDWTRQVQHVYSGSRIQAANALICTGPETTERIMRFDEFSALSSNECQVRLAPFPELLSNFGLREKPILWLRLVAYGYSCNTFINRDDPALGFEQHEFSTAELLAICEDPHIIRHLSAYVDTIESNALAKL